MLKFQIFAGLRNFPGTGFFLFFVRDFAFKKKSPILPIIYETKRGIKIRNKNYSFFMYKQSKRTPFRV